MTPLPPHGPLRLALSVCDSESRHIDQLARQARRVDRAIHPQRLSETLCKLALSGLLLRDGDHWRLTDAGAAAQAGLRGAA